MVKVLICCLLGNGDLGFGRGFSGSGVGSRGGEATSTTGMKGCSIIGCGGGVGNEITSGVGGDGGGVGVFRGSRTGSSNGGGMTSLTIGGSGMSSQSLPLSSSLSKVS